MRGEYYHTSHAEDQSHFPDSCSSCDHEHLWPWRGGRHLWMVTDPSTSDRRTPSSPPRRRWYHDLSPGVYQGRTPSDLECCQASPALRMGTIQSWTNQRWVLDYVNQSEIRFIMNQPIRIQYYLNQVSSTSGSCSSLILSADTLNFLAALLLASCSVLPLTQHSSSVTSGAGLPWTNQRPVLVCVNQSEISIVCVNQSESRVYLTWVAQWRGDWS